MGTVNKKIIIKDIHVPDNYIKIVVSNEKDFFGMIEDEGSYFCNVAETEYLVFGEGMVFIYEK